MRVEGENGGANPPLSTSFCNGVENSLMSEMETIKVADGQNAGAVVRRIGQMGNHFHRVMIIRNDWGKVRKARRNHGQAARP